MRFTPKSLLCSALGLAGVFALLWLWPRSPQTFPESPKPTSFDRAFMLMAQRAQWDRNGISITLEDPIKVSAVDESWYAICAPENCVTIEPEPSETKWVW